MGVRVFFLLVIAHLFHSLELSAQNLAEITLIDSFSVSFDSGSAIIKNPAKVIGRINQLKMKHGKVSLISYTDTVGSYSYNKSLASKRLLAVSKLIDSTSIKSFMRDSTNQNEKRKTTQLKDEFFRRVDVLVYSVIPKITFGGPINLRINFYPTTANIIPVSLENVKTLQLLMEMDTTLCIKLNGHVCCIPDLMLSLNRAEKVKAYLMNQGINGKRITCFGYSNTVPLVPETSVANQNMNMRVEVVFSKSGSR